MTRFNLLIPFLFAGIVLLISCEEEDAPTQEQYYDNGAYDPNSYFPLVNGAVWEYETETGDVFTVSCGPHYVDTLRQYQNRFAYDYHILTPSATHNTLRAIPTLYGKYWKTGIPGDMCIKGGPFSVQFFAGPWSRTGDALRSFDCGMKGPIREDYVISTDSMIQLDGYTEVMGCVFYSNPHSKLAYDTGRSSAYDSLFQIPLRTKAGTLAPVMKTYYAKGVGVIRKETYDENGNITDFIKLKSAYFPQ